MSADSPRLRSWLKPIPTTRTTPSSMLRCEQLEDRLTPSASTYVPQSYFFVESPTAVVAPSADPLAVATAYLNSHAARFNLSPTDLAQSRVTDRYTDRDSGITHIYFRQTVNGLEVENANINVAVSRSGNVITAAGGYVAGLAGTLPPPGSATLTATQAVQKAADALGITIGVAGKTVVSSPGGIANNTVVSAPDLSLDPITARLQYIPTANGSAALSWQLIIRTTDYDHWYDLSIHDSDGAMISQADWVENATYNAIPFPNESPIDGGFQILTDPNDPIASPYGWHDTNGDATYPEFTDTRGNNTSVQLDRNGNNIPDAQEGAGIPRPDGGLTLDFSGFVHDPLVNADLGANPFVAQVNLFYAINTAHDIFYHYGFDEVAGNFQVNNYGRGGLGGDAVQGDAQDDFDNGARNNANFATPPDGFAPRMQQYIFDFTTPTRDSDLDNNVIFHEFGHGVSNRLAGGPSNSSALNSLQAGGASEGWSDFYAQMFLQRPEDTPSAGYSPGLYVIPAGVTPGYPNGVRRFPYSFDMTINPLTFDAFGPNGGTTTYGVTRSTEVHDAGEIWASALWDMNWLLIAKHGYDSNLLTGWSDTAGPAEAAGNKLALDLVNLGLKLQPTNPSFIQMRDAILAADVALTGGANQLEIWTAFARRGLGATASTPNGNADFVLTDFRVPPSVSITPTATSVLEGNSGTTSVTFTVALSAPTPYGLSLNYATVDGTATTADGDYVAASGTLTFAIGETSKTITVQVNGDTVFEPNETFRVTLSSPVKAYVEFQVGTGTVTILNDDAAPLPPPVPPVPPPPPRQVLAIATDGGVVAEVRAIEVSTGATRWAVNPFDGFMGTVSIAVGDINGDGFDDVVVGAGPSAGPRIVVLNGIDGSQLASFFAFAPGFVGGVTVATADFNGDGFGDIVIGAAAGGSSHVKVLDGRTMRDLQSYFAFSRDYAFGISVAAGDVNGDGHPDVLVGAGVGSASQFRVFDGVTGGLIRDGMAFAPEFTGGISIAAGDVDGDGFADVILGAGSSGNPHVKVFSGLNGAVLASFFVNEDFSPDAIPSVALESGVSVAATDLDGDGVDEILTSKGRGTRSVLRSFRIARRDAFGNTISIGLQPVQSISVFDGFTGGFTISG